MKHHSARGDFNQDGDVGHGLSLRYPMQALTLALCQLNFDGLD
jgi:hypothetical protein